MNTGKPDIFPKGLVPDIFVLYVIFAVPAILGVFCNATDQPHRCPERAIDHTRRHAG
jgi:hypothetical protein